MSNNQRTTNLYKAILLLNSPREAERFFRDLMTEVEIKEFENRWQAAQMLSQKISYTQIEKETGLSSRTIARVAQWLNRGQNGYKLMIKRLNHHYSFSQKEKS